MSLDRLLDRLSGAKYALTGKVSPGLLALTLLASSGWAQNVDPDSYYRLENTFAAGKAMAVDLSGDFAPGDAKIIMANNDPSDFRQLWAVEKYGNRIVFTNALAGRSWALALDPALNLLVLEPRNQGASDQSWSAAAFDVGFRLGNSAAAGKSVDSSHENPFLANSGNFSGQVWRFVRIGSIPEPSNVANATVRIRNRFLGTYIYENNGVVTAGALAASDTRGHCGFRIRQARATTM